MWQGVKAAERPWRTIGAAAVVMAVLALGLLRFRVETDPQRLWVGPTSQAAQEKAAYEVFLSLLSGWLASDGLGGLSFHKDDASDPASQSWVLHRVCATFLALRLAAKSIVETACHHHILLAAQL